MRPRRVAIVPAKATSRRIPGKNFKPFWRGMSLLEIKLRALKSCSIIDEIVVSSDDSSARRLAECLGATSVPRSSELCGDKISLGRLFAEVLRPYEADVVYWAHVTSPFVRADTMTAAISDVAAAPRTCAVGVEVLHEFLWDERGPHNYEPSDQPRSQDLPRLSRITGGIHVAVGQRFIETGALVFEPVNFIDMTKLESLDINTPDEWDLCERLAPSVLPEIVKT